jgi:hypothetical protein
MKNAELNIFNISKLYCFGISIWSVFSELHSLIIVKIKFDAIFINYSEILQFALAIYGLSISIIFKLKTKTIYQIRWWIPQLLIINKVTYGFKTVTHSDTIFDLSLLFRIGFSWGFKDKFDVYTMFQINIIAIFGIILLLIERERQNGMNQLELEAPL